MSKELVDSLNTVQGSDSDVFGFIVEAWEGVVVENTAELHLVTEAQAQSWLSFKDKFTDRLVQLGENAVETGVWDSAGLDSARRTLLGAQHKPGEQLRAENPNTPKGDVSGEAKRWLDRLRK